MFRAEIHRLASGPMLKMEGRLVGNWAEQVKSLLTKGSVPEGLIVDLTEVMYVDYAGEQVLEWLKSIGAVFMASNVYAAGVCERLHLPFLETAHARSGRRSTERRQQVSNTSHAV